VKSTVFKISGSEQSHFDFKIGTNQSVHAANLLGGSIDAIDTVGFS
jgi:hypothetical protein